MIGSTARRVRRSLLALSLVGAAGLALPAVPAAAAAPATHSGSTSLHCQITITLNVTPPATFTTQNLAVYSDGVTGTGPCTGTANGKAPTGDASFGTATVQRASCTGGSGVGTFLLKVPTGSVTKTYTGTYKIQSVVDGSEISGGLTGSALGVDYVDGGGDCIDSPLSRYIAFFDVTLTR